jgi:hypothetical protein
MRPPFPTQSIYVRPANLQNVTDRYFEVELGHIAPRPEDSQLFRVKTDVDLTSIRPHVTPQIHCSRRLIVFAALSSILAGFDKDKNDHVSSPHEWCI